MGKHECKESAGRASGSLKRAGSAALDKRIRKAVEADFQQWMIQSLTPDRGYMTPIDNVRALILELVPPNDAGERGRQQ